MWASSPSDLAVRCVTATVTAVLSGPSEQLRTRADYEPSRSVVWGLWHCPMHARELINTYTSTHANAHIHTRTHPRTYRRVQVLTLSELFRFAFRVATSIKPLDLVALTAAEHAAWLAGLAEMLRGASAPCVPCFSMHALIVRFMTT
jgi:hypothetical protein